MSTFTSHQVTEQEQHRKPQLVTLAERERVRMLGYAFTLVMAPARNKVRHEAKITAADDANGEQEGSGFFP